MSSPYKLAQQIYSLKPSQRLPFITSLPNNLEAQVILALSQEFRQNLLRSMSDLHLGQIISHLPEDEAADLLQHLPTSRHETILSQIHSLPASKIRTLLSFGPASSGGLMDLNFLLINSSTPIKNLAKLIHQHIRRHKQAPTVIVTSSRSGRLLGFIPYRNLIISPPSTPLRRLVQHLPTISSSTPQGTLLKKAHRLSSDTLAVLDNDKQIIGVVHLHDLLKLASQQTTQHLYEFAGVNSAEDTTDPILTKVRHRSKWLVLNLATAFLAAYVVSLYEPTIAKLAILAVFMPLIAGEGSNAAMQTLAVTIRGLVTHQLPPRQALDIILKEVAAGLINGLLVALLAIPIALLFNAPLTLALILGLSLIANLFVATLFGSAIPFILKAINIDPAAASSVFVTTATDVIGFLVLLSLATKFLL